MGRDNSNCTICNRRSIVNVGRDVATSSSGQFESGLRLFCKLLNITLPTSIPTAAAGKVSHGDFQELRWMLSSTNKRDESANTKTGNSNVPLCKQCAVPVSEICRIEKLIDDLKISQMVHVSALQRSLLKSKVNESSKCAPIDGCISEHDSFWKLIRNQLIECLKIKSAVVSLASLNCSDLPRPRERRNRPLVKSGTARARMQEQTNMSPVATTPQSNPLIENLGATSSVCQGKRRSNDFSVLLKSEVESGSDEEQHFLFEDDPNDSDYVPSPFPEDKVKDEMGMETDLIVDTKLLRTSEMLQELENDDDSCKGQDEIIVEMKRSSSKKVKIADCSGGRFRYIYPIQQNIYLFQTSFFKWCLEERRLICQHPECRTSYISGSYLDGSLYHNMKLHQKEKHSDFATTTSVECTLCFKVFSTMRHFRTHLTHHMDPSFKPDYESKNTKMVICEICGINVSYIRVVRHIWTHKSFKDKVANIRDGWNVPSNERKKLEKRKFKDPLYPLVYGDDGKYIRNIAKRKSACLSWTLKESDVDAIEEPAEVLVEATASSSNAMPVGAREKYRYIHPIQQNLYLFQTSFFKWCLEERRLICQHSECLTSYISGSYLDGSLFQNMRSHQEKRHSKFGTTTTAQCTLCLKVFSSTGKFRAHLADHMDPSLKPTDKSSNIKMVICEICGTKVHMVRILRHAWTHKSFEDKAADIQSGGSIPPPVRKMLEKRKFKDPLYPLVFGNDSIPEGVRREDILTLPLTTVAESVVKIAPTLINTTNNTVYYLNNDYFLYKATLISVQENGSKLSCHEPGCTETFKVFPMMNYYETMKEMKKHVVMEHEKNYSRWAVTNNDNSVCRACPICGESIQQALELRYHLLVGHFQKNKQSSRKCIIMCETCWKPVKNLEHMYRNHILTHLNLADKETTGAEVINEDEQGKSLKQEQEGIPKAKNIAGVISKRTGRVYKPRPLPPVSCETCGRIFSQKYLLMAHRQSHIPKAARKTWTCVYCPQLFLSPKGVRNHIERIHRPDLKKTKECPVSGCGKVFNYRDSTKFINHMRMHNGETPWICELCGRGFYNQSYFKTHVKNVHLKEGQCQCDLCGKSYSCKKHLRRHTKAAHKNPADETDNEPLTM